MADDETKLLVSLEARLNQFEKAFNKAPEIADRSWQRVERRTKQAADRMDRELGEAVERLNRGLELIGVGIGLREIEEMIDSYTRLSSRLTIAAGSAEKGAAVMERLDAAAKQARVSNDALTNSYLQNKDQLDALGYSTETQIEYHQALAEALKLSGASADKAAAIQDVLTKAIADGSVKGKQLNAVFTDGSRVAKVLADYLGVPVSQLSLLADQGKITSNVLVRALKGSLGQLNAELSKKPVEFNEAITILRDSLEDYVGKAAQSAGVNLTLGESVKWVSDHFNELADGAAAAAAVILSRYVPGLAKIAATAITNPWLVLAAGAAYAAYSVDQYQGQIKLADGSLVQLKDIAGAAWDEIKVGGELAAQTIEAAYVEAVQFITKALSGVGVSLSDLEQFTVNFAQGVVSTFVFVYDETIAVFKGLPPALAELFIGALNGIRATFEDLLNFIVDGLNNVIGLANVAGDKIGAHIPTFDRIDLGRATNSYEGAGQALGKALGDGIDDAMKPRVRQALAGLQADASAALAGFQKKAAEHAQTRQSEAQQEKPGIIDTQDHEKPAVNKQFEADIRKFQQNIALLKAETAARAQASGSVENQESQIEAFKQQQELLNQAQEAGVEITDQVKDKINALSEAYRQAALAAKETAKELAEANKFADGFEQGEKSAFQSFFTDLAHGTSAAEAFRKAMANLGDKLLSLGLSKISDSLFNGTGDFLRGGPQSGSVGSANISAGVVNVGGSSVPGVGSLTGGSAGSTLPTASNPLGGLGALFGLGSASKSIATNQSASPQVTQAAKEVAETSLPTIAATPAFKEAATKASESLPIAERTFFQAKDKLPDFTSTGFKEAAFAAGKDTTPLSVTKYPGLRNFGPEMKDPQNFIVHHTGGGNTASTVDTLNQRGYGVQYTVDKSGKVFQLTPHPDNIASHIEPTSARDYLRRGAPPGVDNSNSIGVEVQAANDKAVTEAQKLSTAKLYDQLHQQYPNLNNVYGHGVINPGHKEADEGKTISTYINQQEEAQKQLQTQLAQTTTSIKAMPPALQGVQVGSQGLDGSLGEMTSTLAQGAPAANGFASSLQSLVGSLASKPAGGGGLGLGSIFGFADGGFVSGKGTGTSDSIPAMLSDGEFVVPAKQASKNAAVLSMINDGKVPRFAAGGPVNGGSFYQGGHTNNIHVDARGSTLGEADIKAAVGKALDARKPQQDTFRRSEQQKLAAFGLASDKAARRNG